MARDDEHRFSKPTRESITLVAGIGVEGVMSIVLRGGDVRPGDGIRVIPPAGADEPLQAV